MITCAQCAGCLNRSLKSFNSYALFDVQRNVDIGFFPIVLTSAEPNCFVTKMILA